MSRRRKQGLPVAAIPPLEEQLSEVFAQSAKLIVKVGKGITELYQLVDGIANRKEPGELAAEINELTNELWENSEEEEWIIDEGGNFHPPQYIKSHIHGKTIMIPYSQYGARFSQLGYTSRVLKETILSLLRLGKIQRAETLFDTNRNRYLTLDGVLDLEAKGVTPAHPSEVFTRRVNARYKQGYTIDHPEFQKFRMLIWEATKVGDPDDNAYVEAILSVLAYLLFVRMNPLKIIAIIVGPGNSGKSTLINVLSKIFTGLTGTLDPVSISISPLAGNDKRPDLLLVADKNVAFVPEGENSRTFATSTCKMLAGNDLLAGRMLYGNTVNYVFYATLCLVTNEIPKFDGADGAFVKRLLTLEFKNTVPDSRMNINLEAELLEPDSRDAIFSVLADYAFKYMDTGKLIMHTRMSEAKARLILQNSKPVWKYLSEKVEYLPIGDLASFQPKWSSQYLYHCFLLYCQEKGIVSEGSKGFYRDLRDFFADAPGVKFKQSGNRHHYTGFRLKDTPLDVSYYRDTTDELIQSTATNSIVRTSDPEGTIQQILLYYLLNKHN